MSKPSEKRIVMAKEVARRYLEARAHPEFRFSVLYGAKAVKNVFGLLRSFRDGKIAMEGVKPLPDLGVREEFDKLTVWSSNKQAIESLQDWFEKRGFETTGVFW